VQSTTVDILQLLQRDATFRSLDEELHLLATVACISIGHIAASSTSPFIAILRSRSSAFSQPTLLFMSNTRP
jgi:hypothetical protein